MLNEYLHLLSDPAHIMVEATVVIVVDGLLLGLAMPFARKWLANHDKEKHGPIVDGRDATRVEV